MYAADPTTKYRGALAMGVPGELAGLHATWTRYGRLPWRDLIMPTDMYADPSKYRGTLALAVPGELTASMSNFWGRGTSDFVCVWWTE